MTVCCTSSVSAPLMITRPSWSTLSRCLRSARSAMATAEPGMRAPPAPAGPYRSKPEVMGDKKIAGRVVVGAKRGG